MRVNIYNRWSINWNDENLEDDSDFEFHLFNIVFSWRLRYINVIIFNFEINIYY